MKKLTKLILIATATCLATAGYAQTADALYKKALPDLESNDLGTISMGNWCAVGPGDK